jgi:hypothetical protein
MRAQGWYESLCGKHGVCTAVFRKHERFLLRLSEFNVFCLCLFLPMPAVGSSEVSSPASLVFVDALCLAFIKPPTGPWD